MRACAMSEMSPPAQKCPPLPRTTTARTLGSCSAAFSPASSSLTMASDIALRTSGRLSVRVQTPWAI